MHKYCLDTSGLSNPFMDMPEDIYVSLWSNVMSRIDAGVFCWNVEIAEELEGIFGSLGDCLKACNGYCCLEVGIGDWPWQDYLQLVDDWRNQYRPFISEYNGNRKSTVSLNDLSIVALANTLKLPAAVSMEKRNTGHPSSAKLRIPDLCDRVSVRHLSFNEFLAAEGITV